jgi:putative SOS response-associated peptidase YedK
MCSRFELNADSRDLAGRFRLTVPPPMPSRCEARPTDSVLVLGSDDARLMPWGLAVEWQAAPLINARAETLAAKPTFRSLLAGGRVLIPASAWWEWPRRVKTRIALVDQPVFAMAGLSDGRRVVIITCAPAAGLEAVHDRMPVVLTPEAEAAWIDGGTPFDAVSPLLRPHEGPFAATPEAAQGDLFG